MDFIFDTLINLLAHRIGVYVLGLLSGGRFKGESGCLGLGSRRRRLGAVRSFRGFHSVAHPYQW
ncbi:hypothetical protein C8K63_11853 [Pseudomonas sp. GV085]|nr:hypothetical protein C8K63_11853 [Pseudomonas sp. GV085]